MKMLQLQAKPVAQQVLQVATSPSPLLHPPSRVVLVGAGGRTGIPDETLTTMLARILPLNAHGLCDLVDGCRTSSFAYGVDNYRHKGLN